MERSIRHGRFLHRPTSAAKELIPFYTIESARVKPN